MLARIAQAYRQFSYFSGNVSRASRTAENESVPAKSTTNSVSVEQNKLERDQARKITQLRDTGTLKSLQKIFNESEELLLKKLFTDRSLQSVGTGDNGSKGQRLDGRY